MLLLADSQLLFRTSAKAELKQRIHSSLGFSQTAKPGQSPVRVAYIGAANHNEPTYSELAQAAFETLVPAAMDFVLIGDEQDLPLELCQIVILAGGSVSRGWDFIGNKKIRAWLQRCRQQQNNLFVGVSAGALHLAGGCDPELGLREPPVQRYLGWFPFNVVVHEELIGWPSAQVSMRQQPGFPVVGIPMGAAIWVESGEWSALDSGGAIIRLN